MFDYVRRLQLAASDTGRRVGMKAGAGVLAALAAGFAVAALWTFLARTLDLGPLWASVIVAILFGAGAAILMAMSKSVKHPMPPVSLLQREVEARVSLATDAALDKAKEKAREVVDLAENKVHGLIDTATHKASSLVDGVEGKVQTLARSTVSNAARKVGLDGGAVDEMTSLAREVRDSRLGPAVGVLGAFALGVALAAKLAPQAEDEYWDEDDYDGEDTAYV